MAKRVSLRIHYSRRSGLAALLTLALLVAVFLGHLAWGQREAAASGSQASLAASASLRGYYLTTSFYNGANASTVCDSGYHMASLWEILDTSSLKYNTNEGITQDDSGQGPPTWYEGWVRTGWSSDTNITPGQANCNGWSSSSGSHYGTSAYLPRDWSAGQDIHVWKVGAWGCSHTLPVWCVEDIVYKIYLPLVLRNFS